MRSFTAALAVLLVSSASDALAGDMKAVVKKGTLSITDSAGDDNVTIDQVGVMNPQQFRVTPGMGTTVNASGAIQFFDGVTLDILVQHAAGTDSTNVSGITAPRDLRITAKQLDALYVSLTSHVEIGRDLTIDSRSTDIGLSSIGPGSTVHRDLRVKHRAVGSTSVQLNPLHVLRDTRIDGTDGVDFLSIGANVQLIGNVTLNSAGGTDLVLTNATTVIGGNLKFRGKSGTKSLSIAGPIVGDIDVQVGNAPNSSIAVFSPQIGGSVRAAFGSGTPNQLIMSGSDISGDVTCTSKGDADTVSLGGTLIVGGDVSMNLAAGSNTLTVSGTVTVAGDLSFTGGAGHDVVSIATASIWGDVRTKLGSSPAANSDTFSMTSTSVLGAVDVNATAGQNDGILDTVTVWGPARLNFGSGGSTYIVDSCSFHSLLVQATAGDDQLTLTGGTLETIADIRLLLGGGNNFLPIDHVACGRDLVIQTGGGDDTVTLATSTIVGATDIGLGGGVNSGP